MRPLWRALRLIGHVWAMTRTLLVARRFDVVHVHFLGVPALDVWWLPWFARRARLVYTVHNLYPHDTPPSEGLRRLLDRIYRTSDALIAHTRHTARGLEQDFSVSPERLRIIPLGNYNQYRTQARTPLELAPPGVPVILMFGELRPGKGLDVLIRAADILQRDGLAFRVVVAGKSDHDVSTYRALIEERGLQHVVDLQIGHVAEADIGAYFAAATVIALPYRAIDQSAVAILAVSVGRAIVASRVGGLAELIEEADCGVLVPPGDPNALAAALRRLLTDVEERRRYERNGRRYADTALAWDRIAEETVAVYRRLRRR